jgi:hypothetical protein
MNVKLTTFLLLVAFMAVRCSEEKVEPIGPEEDVSTHMQSYLPTFCAIEITTISGSPDDLPELTEFYLGGNAAKVSVNWGDGTIEKVTLDDSRNYFSHQYDRNKNYTIKITGELTKITALEIYYQHMMIRNLYLAGLTNLEDLTMGLNYSCPSVINLSHNKKIQRIEVGDEEISDIIIPSTNKLHTVLLDGPNNLSTAVVDRIISRVYASVKANPRSGAFGLKARWYEEENIEMVGPPSSYSITKLRKLRSNYGWIINTDID